MGSAHSTKAFYKFEHLCYRIGVQKELGFNSLYIFCPWDLDRAGHDCSVCVVLVIKMDGSAKKTSLK
mgnify:CR=1 FL=1